MEQSQENELFMYIQKLHMTKSTHQDPKCDIPAELLRTEHINGKNSNGETVLSYVIKHTYCDKHIMQLLQVDGININQQDNEGFTALMHAVEERKFKAVTAILQVPGIDINIRNKDGASSFKISIYKYTNKSKASSEDSFYQLLKREDLDMDEMDDRGYSALFCAIQTTNYWNSQLILDLLDDSKTPVMDQQRKEQKQNSFQCILEKYTLQAKILQSYNVPTQWGEILAKLLSHPNFTADISEIRTPGGRTPLHILVTEGHLQQLYTFLLNSEKKSSNIKMNYLEIKHNEGIDVWEAMLLSLILSNREKTVFALNQIARLESVNVNHILSHRNLEGTLLHTAIALRLDGFVSSILQNVNVNPNFTEGELTAPLLTALTQADDNYDKYLVAYKSDKKSSIQQDITILTSLLAHPATDVNIMDSQGMTALMYFSIKNLPTTETDRLNFKEVFMNLIKRPNIQINAVDNKGMSAFLYAFQQKKLEVFQALLDHPELDLNMEYTITHSDSLHILTALQFMLHQHKIPKWNFPVSKQVPRYITDPKETYKTSLKRLMITKLVSNDRCADDVNQYRTPQGLSPMHLLIVEGCFTTIDTFLSNRKIHNEFPHVDPFVEDDDGISVWEALCLSHMHNKMVHPESQDLETQKTTSLKLIEKSLIQLVTISEVDINKQGNHDKSLLHFLCTYGIDEVTSKFLEMEDLNLNIKDKEGYTALMYGVGKLNVQTIGKFLNHPGCDLQVRNNYEQTVQIILDSIESTKLDPRVKSLITAAFEKSNSKQTKTEIATELGIAEQLIFLKKSFEKDPFFTKEEKERFFTQIEGIESDVQVTRGKHPVPQDSMSDVHTRKLLKKRVYLCDELTPKEVFDYLIQDDILKEDKVEEIKLEGTRRGMCQKLLSILPRCGKNAYPSLIRALNESGQGHIAKELETFNPDEEPQNQLTEGTMQLFGNQGLISGNQVMMAAGGSASVVLPVQMTTDGAAFVAIPVMNVVNASK